MKLYEPYLVLQKLVSIIYSLFIDIEHYLSLFKVIGSLYLRVATDDYMNTEKLRKAVIDSETKDFYFDPRIIDWEYYILHTHIPG